MFDIEENQISNGIDAVLDTNTANTSNGIADGILDPINYIDADRDGLADIFEGADLKDGFDVNDEMNTPVTNLPDVDSDVATEDVDYRDAEDNIINPNLTGNTLWLRADKNVTGGSSVTLWEDQTASLDFVSNVAQAPDATVNLLNFNPTVTFAPDSNTLLTYTGNLNPRTMYIVYNDISTNSWVTPFTNNDNIGHGHADDTQIYNGDPTNFTPLEVQNGEEYVNGLSSNFLTQDRPDTFEQQTRIFTDNISNTDRNYFIGNDRDFNNRTIDGSIAEIILFSDAHSAIKKQQVETYLAIKYGFTLNSANSTSVTDGDYVLSAGNLKIWNYATNAQYHNDVAAIGRDDAMVLNQKQSKSVNTDAIVTIGLNAIATDNISNTTSFNANKDFLVWGNNNGAINATTTTELICAPEKTIGRTWKIVENGNVDATQVSVDKGIIDLALNTPNTIKVLKVADNANFTSNVTYIPLLETTINAESVYATAYNFNGTKYFTYAEINGIFWNGNSNAWSGGASVNTPGAPSTNIADRNKVLVIDAETSLTHAVLTENAAVECVWIKAASKLMVSDNRYLEFDEDFILDGQLKLIGDGQLVQTHTGLSNVQGSGTLFRDQKAVVPSVYRYHYWSAPVRELRLDTYRVGHVMKDGNIPTSATSKINNINWVSGFDGAPGIAGTAPIKIASYWIYTFLNGVTIGDYVQKRETNPIRRAQGYTMKSTGQNPQNFTFVGTPNDGSITFNLAPNTTSILGNPYPSALDATDFINTNIDKIDGTLYFWEHTGEDASNPATSEGHNLTGYQGGYSQRNISMGIAANGVGSLPSLVFNWADATLNGDNITQTVAGVTATVSKSSGTFNVLPNLLGVGGSIGNVIGSPGLNTSLYDVTFNFSSKVDLKSIYLYNNVVTNLLNRPEVTLTPNGGENIITQELSGVTGQEITLNWEDVTSFTITTNNPYNLIIDNLKFSAGNLPSLGTGTYTAPNRYVAVGQGFFVTSSITGGVVRFENSQRNYQSDNYVAASSGTNGSGTYFFKSDTKKAAKSATEEELDLLPRLKLGFNHTVSGDIKAHRQIGISFRNTNSFGFDNGYDSEIYDLSATDFYWHFPKYSNKKLIIAGVSAIKKGLEIPLTVKLGTNNPFSIQIDEVKNIRGAVFLLDKLTDTYYTLSNTPQEIVLPEGSYSDRFYITFSEQVVLSLEDTNPLNKELAVFMDAAANELVIQNSKLVQIKKVTIYNLLGQEIKLFKDLENITEHRLLVNKLSSTVYIINIETAQGSISKKIVIE